MREEIKLIGAFSLVGLGIGLGVVLFEADPPQPKALIVLYYGISAVWVLFSKIANLTKSKFAFAFACMASGSIAGSTLLALGYQLVIYKPDPTFNDYMVVSASFAIGALSLGIAGRWAQA
ncbi:hypothetical protein V6D52_14320 [Idiomarina loihiensis]|uniref:hypothetical protein n=1 Tax=Idiomarina loihiensis TaxID=135577 RepID=UPI0039BE4984